MRSHIAAMRERISAALGLQLDQVNVKAKTAEKLGPVGQGLAIEARAVVLLVPVAAEGAGIAPSPSGRGLG
jgi:2-C-methyl-D-erythritol 2,4-cyclodiphosphate synthase